MWHKSITGLLAGIIFMFFIPPAISLITPQSTAIMIVLGIVVFIPASAGIMTYCYAANSNKQTWIRAFQFILPSCLLYLSTYLIFGLPQ